MPASPNDVDRMGAVEGIIKSLQATYPDAKRLQIKIKYEWQETSDDYGAELCPIVDILVER